MKIKKTIKYKEKLIELELLNTKIYEKNYDINLNIFTTKLKTILHLIYKYHMLKKKILFVGTPLKIHKQIENLLKNTKHTVIPESVWVNGLFTNKRFCFKYLIKNQAINNTYSSKFLLQIKEKPDLIVVINKSSNKVISQELMHARVPVISLDNSFDANKNLDLSYRVNGTFNFTAYTQKDNFFYCFLKATIKKAKRLKKFKTKIKK